MEGPQPDQDARGRSVGERPSRRDVLDSLLAAGSAIWAAGVAIPAALYLWPARSSGPTSNTLEVDPESLPPGTGKVLSSGGKPVLVVRLRNGEFRALSAVCTHLGCIVHWDAGQDRIACPCHAGFFTPDGDVISGPPPRPLAVYSCRIVEGTLRIVT
jgi:cytochrome b6-f complex iron-sulfur subunit